MEEIPSGNANPVILETTGIRLLKAVRFMNACSLTPLTSGIQVMAEDGLRTIRSAGGHYLFLDCCQRGRTRPDTFSIRVASAIFQPMDILLQTDPDGPAEDILLYPSRSYPVPEGCTIIQGHARAGLTLYFYLQSETSLCRLMQDYTAGDKKIFLYQRGGTRHSCPLWHIGSPKQCPGEYFQLSGFDPESQTYTLSQPLSDSYTKKDAAVCPAHVCRTAPDGTFYLLIPGLAHRSFRLHYETRGICMHQTGRIQNGSVPACIHGETGLTGARPNYLDIPDQPAGSPVSGHRKED